MLPLFIEPAVKEDGINTNVWAMICVMTSLATISMSVISCLSDAFAMNSSKKYNVSFGSLRVWGTIGWGLASIILSFINQSKKVPFLVPGIILLIILIMLDIILVSFWPEKDDFDLNKSARQQRLEDITTNTSNIDNEEVLNGPLKPNYGTTSPTRGETNNNDNNTTSNDSFGLQIQWDLFKKVVIMRPSIIRYMVLFVISGSLIALQWSFFFEYLQKNFQNDFSLVSGLSMFSQSMLGELPFFILSHNIVRCLGRSLCLSVSMGSIGIRYLLYQFLLTRLPYYGVLFIEPLAGPSFSLFYVVMTDVGLDYSDCEAAINQVISERHWNPNDTQLKDRLKDSLRATMQGVMGACYEGLGVGLGSLFGGRIIDSYGFDRLWIGSSIIAISISFINFGLDFLRLPFLGDEVIS